MHPLATLPRRPYRQPGEGQQIRGAVADFVDNESPRPADPSGAGNRAIEIGAGQPQHEKQHRQRPAAQRDGHRGRPRRHHPGHGEHIR